MGSSDKNIRINTEITGTNLIYLQRLNDELAVLATNMAKIKATGINLGGMNQSAQAQAIAQQKATQQQTNLNNQATIASQKFAVAQANLENQQTRANLATQKLATQQANLNKQVSTAITQNETFLTQITHNIAKVAEWAVATGLVYGSLRLLGTAVNDITKVDYATASMAKVMRTGGLSADQQKIAVRGLSREVRELAAQYGEMGSTALEGAVEWVRLGRSQQATLTGIRASLLAQAVAEMSTVDATKYLIATLQQFHKSGLEAVNIIDQWNNLSNKYAVRTLDMAQAAGRAGSVMRQVGVDLETLNGITTALVQSTGRSGIEIGTAMRTIGTYAYRLQTVPKLLHEAGVQVEDFAGNQKDLMSILTELSGKWDSYTDVVKSHIAATMAGVRRVNEFYTIMEQMPLILKASKDAYNSLNSAQIESGIYMDTLQKRTDQLRSHFENLNYVWANRSLPLMKLLVSGVDSMIVGFTKTPALVTPIIAVFTIMALEALRTSVAIEKVATSLKLLATNKYFLALLVAAGAAGVVAGAVGEITKRKEAQKQAVQTGTEILESTTKTKAATVLQFDELLRRYKNPPAGLSPKEMTAHQLDLQVQMAESLGGTKGQTAPGPEALIRKRNQIDAEVVAGQKALTKTYETSLEETKKQQKLLEKIAVIQETNPTLKGVWFTQEEADLLKGMGMTETPKGFGMPFRKNAGKMEYQRAIDPLKVREAYKNTLDLIPALQEKIKQFEPEVNLKPLMDYQETYDELVQKIDDFDSKQKVSLEIAEKSGKNISELNKMKIAGLVAENAIYDQYIIKLRSATGDDEKLYTQAIDNQGRLKQAIKDAGLEQQAADLTLFIEKEMETYGREIATIQNDTAIRVANRNAVNDQRGALDEEKKGLLEQIEVIKKAQAELSKQGVVSETLDKNIFSLGLQVTTLNSQYGLLKTNLDAVNNALEYMNNLIDIQRQKAERAGAPASALAEFDIKKLMEEDKAAVKKGDWLRHALLWNQIRAMRTEVIPTMRGKEEYSETAAALSTQQALSLNAKQFIYNPVQTAQQKLANAQAQLQLAKQKRQPTEELELAVTNAYMEKWLAGKEFKRQVRQQTFETQQAAGERRLNLLRALGYDEQSLAGVKNEISNNLKKLNAELFGAEYIQQFKDNQQAIQDTLDQTSAEFVIAQIESARKVKEAYLDAFDAVKQSWTDTIVNVLSGNKGALLEHLKTMQTTLLSRALENSPLVAKLSSWEQGLLNPAAYAEAKETERRLALQSMLTSSFITGGDVLANSIISASAVAGNNLAMGTQGNPVGIVGPYKSEIPTLGPTLAEIKGKSSANISQLGWGNYALAGVTTASQAYSSYQAGNKGGAIGTVAGGVVGGVAGTLLGGNTVLGIAIGSAIGNAIGTAVGKNDTTKTGATRQEESLKNVLADTINRGAFNNAANITYNISNSYSLDFLIPDSQQIKRVSDMLADYSKNIKVA